MSPSTCPECQQLCPKYAQVCPFCGHPLAAPALEAVPPANALTGLHILVGISAGILLLAIVGLAFARFTSPEPSAETRQLKQMELEIERLKQEQAQLKQQAAPSATLPPAAAPTALPQAPHNPPPQIVFVPQGTDCRSLWIQRNTLYARYGRRFQTPEIRNYFQQQAWYQPNPDYHDGLLSAAERQAAAQILAQEKTNGCL